MFDELIGTPFKYGGRGPDFFDCYGLLKLLQKEVNGVDIPDFNTPEDGCGSRIAEIFSEEIVLWKKCELKRGATLLLRVPGNVHVGMYMGEGRFLHTWERSGGVSREYLSDWKNRVIGVYEYVGE